MRPTDTPPHRLSRSLVSQTAQRLVDLVGDGDTMSYDGGPWGTQATTGATNGALAATSDAERAHIVSVGTHSVHGNEMGTET